VSAPSPFVVHQGRDEDTGVEFMVTTFGDGLVTIATRAPGETTWSRQHALNERTEIGADGSEVRS
jgi:hypothetical protein